VSVAPTNGALARHDVRAVNDYIQVDSPDLQLKNVGACHSGQPGSYRPSLRLLLNKAHAKAGSSTERRFGLTATFI